MNSESTVLDRLAYGDVIKQLKERLTKAEERRKQWMQYAIQLEQELLRNGITLNTTAPE